MLFCEIIEIAWKSANVNVTKVIKSPTANVQVSRDTEADNNNIIS